MLMRWSLRFLLLVWSLPMLCAAAQDELIAAAQRGSLAVVQQQIEADADLNARDIDGATALLYAAHAANIEIVQALLAAGADPNLSNRYGLAPLHEASMVADPALMAVLIESGANVEAALPEGETPLMLASRTSNANAVQLLIDRGADANVVESWQGQTPLMYAAAFDRADVAAALIAAGADVNAATSLIDLPERLPAARFNVEFPPGGMTPLLFAARQGASNALPVLIEAGADIDVRTGEGFSALVVALHNRHNDAAKILIDAGADLGGGALYTVIDARNRVALIGPRMQPTGSTSELELLAAMLERGADLMDRSPRPLPDRDPGFGSAFDVIVDTALIRASRSADLEAMRMLIDAGADPTTAEPNGLTTLLAVTAGPEIPPLTVVEREMPEEPDAIEAIVFLLDLGVEINARDVFGATALHTVAKRGFVSVADFLIEQGAAINAPDNKGLTPLDYALGRTPVMFGAPPQSPEAAALLRSRGAQEGGAGQLAAQP
jgi:ankyrin repeat protein